MSVSAPRPSGLPAAGEYDPHYGPYVSLAPEPDLVGALERQLAEGIRFYRSIPAGRADHRYAPGKWSVREVIGHVADTERIFTFRAFAFARGEKAPLPGADEDGYARHSGFSAVPLADVIDEYEAVRRASILLFRHLPEEAWLRRGVANGKPISVRALGYAALGHERHHARLLRERYGLGS